MCKCQNHFFAACLPYMFVLEYKQSVTDTIKFTGRSISDNSVLFIFQQFVADMDTLFGICLKFIAANIESVVSLVLFPDVVGKELALKVSDIHQTGAPDKKVGKIPDNAYRIASGIPEYLPLQCCIQLSMLIDCNIKMRKFHG